MLSTFIFKLIFALTFVVPFLFLTTKVAMITSFVWGAVLLTSYSIYLAKKQEIIFYQVVLEHLGIATFVIICTYYLGKYIPLFFN